MKSKVLRNPGILVLVVLTIVGITVWLILRFGLPIELAWTVIGIGSVVFIVGVFTYLGNSTGG